MVVGSLCDENVQYNMPGNLRAWNQETNQCKILKGHRARDEKTRGISVESHTVVVNMGL